MIVAAVTTQRSIAMVIGTVLFIGAVFVVITQMRKGRPELGSEIELAPNRKEYLPDEELEGPKLNAALWASFGLLVVVAVVLPLYWLAEPGRMNGAIADYQATFEERGLTIYTTDAKCEGCHGPKGVGGSTKYIINRENGSFDRQVTWNAPALNTVLYRFSKTEVKEILTYGRPGTPMPAWGVAGGGALNDQQLNNVIDYLWSIQLDHKTVQAQVDDYVKSKDQGLHDRMLAVRTANADAKNIDPEKDGYQRLGRQDELLLGEILFNASDTASGSYSCSRCHVAGASYGQAWVTGLSTNRYAPNLIGIEKDLTELQHFDLLYKGSEYGKPYGVNKLGSGRMPGFGLNANIITDRPYGEGLEPASPSGTIPPRPAVDPNESKLGMMSPEQIWAIVTYERHLDKVPYVINAQKGANP